MLLLSSLLQKSKLPQKTATFNSWTGELKRFREGQFKFISALMHVQ